MSEPIHAIYPECEHTPPCYNGIGPCYQREVEERLTAEGIYAAGDHGDADDHPPTFEEDPSFYSTVDQITDDANRIYDLIMLTGLTDAEYGAMCGLIGTGRFNSWHPRTFEPKLDDNISFLAWATLCEVDGCPLVAHPCECGSAHCNIHPHIGGNPL
jgi:hypothetical protein